MLKINPSPTFEFDAQITVPGQESPGTIRITAKHKGRTAFGVWLAAASAAANDAELLHQVFTAWAGPLDEQGEPAPYSLANLTKLLDAYPTSSKELFDQYVDALTLSRRKN